MSDNADKPSKWGRVDDRLGKTKRERTAKDGGLIASPAKQALVPSPLDAPLPDPKEKGGFLERLQKGQIDRRTAVSEFQDRCDAQLEALRFQLRKAVSVSNARADLVAEEYLKGLDAEHLEVLADLGLRNTRTRAESLKSVTDMIVQQMKEVQEKDWPAALIDSTIDELLALRARTCAELMRELGD
jgi:hypothetical protein